MQINDCVLEFKEKIIYKLRETFLNYGYSPYRMSKFEEYDLYAKNKDFLISDNVITFTDTNGKLMALKPDVTLSIIKNSDDDPSSLNKVFYNENVYRVSKDTNSFKEIMQCGVECVGKIESENIFEIIKLAKDALSLISNESIITMTDVDIIGELIDKVDLTSKEKTELLKAVAEKNIPEIEKITASLDDKSSIEKIKKLLTSGTDIKNAKNTLTELFKNGENSKVDSLISLLDRITEEKLDSHLKTDFSLLDDLNYYNGIIFKGYIRNIPNAVLSGGQYDRLMKKLHRKSKAIGFAVYTDVIESEEDIKKDDEDHYINIALPKGRLGEKVYNIFSKAGYPCPSILEENRKLIFENDEKKIRYFWVKPSDVAIYVERGSADIGVAGRDILLEYSPDVYELLDLDIGKCKMAVAAPKGFCDNNEKTLKVATKFSNIAGRYYQSIGRDIDIIHLNGSIEIAPILKLSDVIVDIVETGTTLKENNLEVITAILPISARLVSNKTSHKFKEKEITKIVKNLSKILEEKQK